jgi:transcriptional regulator with XRE-family HTH domain
MDFEKWLTSVVGQDRVNQLKKEARISAQIIKARHEQGMSQQDLAKAAGVAKSTIGRIEAGLMSPNAETLFKISKALGVPFVIDGTMEDEGYLMRA